MENTKGRRMAALRHPSIPGRELGNREESDVGWQSKEEEIIIIKREMK